MANNTTVYFKPLLPDCLDGAITLDDFVFSGVYTLSLFSPPVAARHCSGLRKGGHFSLAFL